MTFVPNPDFVQFCVARAVEKSFLKFYVLYKNGLRIALGRLVNAVEKNVCEIFCILKNGMRNALGRLVKAVL